MALVLFATVLAFHAWMWRRMFERVASGQLAKLRGTARYGMSALLPLFGFVASMLSAVGLEEWWGVALVSDSMARASPLICVFLLAAAGVSSLGFAIRCAYIKVACVPRAGV